MRSLPEHTVDCWVAAGVHSTFPGRAVTWAPTQNDPNNWDLAVGGTGLRKEFLLENKACEWTVRRGGRSGHTIRIDCAQLRVWTGNVPFPVYYVLPVPPWGGGPVAHALPAYAACALPNPACGVCGSAHPRGFLDWAYVMEAHALSGALGTRLRQASFTRDVAWFRLAAAGRTLGSFLDAVQRCEEVEPTAGKQLDDRIGDLDHLEGRARGAAGLLAARIAGPFG